MQSEVTWHRYSNGFTHLDFLKNLQGQLLTEVQHKCFDTFYLLSSLYNEDLPQEIWERTPSRSYKTCNFASSCEEWSLWNGRLIIPAVDLHHCSCSFEWNNFKIRTIRYSLPCEIYHFLTFLSVKNREKRLEKRRREKQSHRLCLWVSLGCEKQGVWAESSMKVVECLPTFLEKKRVSSRASGITTTTSARAIR